MHVITPKLNFAGWLCLELHVCDLNEFDFEAFEGKLQPHEYAMNQRLLTVELQLL